MHGRQGHCRGPILHPPRREPPPPDPCRMTRNSFLPRHPALPTPHPMHPHAHLPHPHSHPHPLSNPRSHRPLHPHPQSHPYLRADPHPTKRSFERVEASADPLPAPPRALFISGVGLGPRGIPTKQAAAARPAVSMIGNPRCGPHLLFEEPQVSRQHTYTALHGQAFRQGRGEGPAYIHAVHGGKPIHYARGVSQQQKQGHQGPQTRENHEGQGYQVPDRQDQGHLEEYWQHVQPCHQDGEPGHYPRDQASRHRAKFYNGPQDPGWVSRQQPWEHHMPASPTPVLGSGDYWSSQNDELSHTRLAEFMDPCSQCRQGFSDALRQEHLDSASPYNLDDRQFFQKNSMHFSRPSVSHASILNRHSWTKAETSGEVFDFHTDLEILQRAITMTTWSSYSNSLPNNGEVSDPLGVDLSGILTPPPSASWESQEERVTGACTGHRHGVDTEVNDHCLAPGCAQREDKNLQKPEAVHAKSLDELKTLEVTDVITELEHAIISREHYPKNVQQQQKEQEQQEQLQQQQEQQQQKIKQQKHQKLDSQREPKDDLFILKDAVVYEADRSGHADIRKLVIGIRAFDIRAPDTTDSVEEFGALEAAWKRERDWAQQELDRNGQPAQPLTADFLATEGKTFIATASFGASGFGSRSIARALHVEDWQCLLVADWDVSDDQHLKRLVDPADGFYTRDCSDSFGRALTYCTFCRKMGADVTLYTQHTLRSISGMVVCPLLRLAPCPNCSSGSGPSARLDALDVFHPRKHCPKRSGHIKQAVAEMRPRPPAAP